MLGTFTAYLGIGKLIIFIVQKFVADNTRIEFVNRLASCDLCAGVWIYSILAYFLQIQILSDLLPYIPFLSEFIAGCVSSFLMHLLTIGWNEKFSVVVI